MSFFLDDGNVVVEVREGMLPWRYRTAAVDRFERRLAEETGRLRVEAAELRATLRGEMAALRQEMTTGFAALRQENLEGRVELLKWCFMFWVGQVFAVGGIVAVVMRLMRA